MTLKGKFELINDETGAPEIDVSLNIYNLDAKSGEASQTLADVVGGLAVALKDYDAETGAPVA